MTIGRDVDGSLVAASGIRHAGPGIGQDSLGRESQDGEVVVVEIADDDRGVVGSNRHAGRAHSERAKDGSIGNIDRRDVSEAAAIGGNREAAVSGDGGTFGQRTDGDCGPDSRWRRRQVDETHRTGIEVRYQGRGTIGCNGGANGEEAHRNVGYDGGRSRGWVNNGRGIAVRVSHSDEAATQGNVADVGGATNHRGNTSREAGSRRPIDDADGANRDTSADRRNSADGEGAIGGAGGSLATSSRHSGPGKGILKLVEDSTHCRGPRIGNDGEHNVLRRADVSTQIDSGRPESDRGDADRYGDGKLIRSRARGKDDLAVHQEVYGGDGDIVRSAYGHSNG